MPRTQDDIDKIAQRTRDAGLPDDLNRWLGMTPEKLAESEAKIRRYVAADNTKRSTEMPRTKGPKEQALAGMRDAPAQAASKSAKRPKTAAAPSSAPARKPVKDTGDKTPSAGRPAEKQDTIRKLLASKSKAANKHGCTAKEVMEACNWPSVSMPQQAAALDLTLYKFKPEGQPTRYASSPFPGQEAPAPTA